MLGGRSPGKRIVGVHVRRLMPVALANGVRPHTTALGPLSLPASVMRAVFKTAFWVLIPLLWLPLWLQNPRGGATPHDLLARTTVLVRRGRA